MTRIVLGLLLPALLLGGCTMQGGPQETAPQTESRVIFDGELTVDAGGVATASVTVPANVTGANVQFTFSGAATGFQWSLGACTSDDTQTVVQVGGAQSVSGSCGPIVAGAQPLEARADGRMTSVRATVTADVRIG